MMQWDLECFVYCMWWIYGFTYCTAHTPPHTYSIWFESNFINQSSSRSEFWSYSSTRARTCGRSNNTRVVLYLRYPSASDFGCCGCWWNDTWYRSLVSNNNSSNKLFYSMTYHFAMISWWYVSDSRVPYLNGTAAIPTAATATRETATYAITRERKRKVSREQQTMTTITPTMVPQEFESNRIKSNLGGESLPVILPQHHYRIVHNHIFVRGVRSMCVILYCLHQSIYSGGVELSWVELSSSNKIYHATPRHHPCTIIDLIRSNPTVTTTNQS